REARDVGIGVFLLHGTADEMTIGAELLGQNLALLRVRFRGDPGNGKRYGEKQQKGGEHIAKHGDLLLSARASYPLCAHGGKLVLVEQMDAPCPLQPDHATLFQLGDVSSVR